jgi:AraC-like DNA-binding protein
MPESPGPTISAAFTRLIDDWLDRHHLPAPHFRERLAWQRQHARIGLRDWMQLLDDAQALRPGEPAGLQIGAGIRARHVGTLGYLVLNCNTLCEALDTYLHCEHQFYGINFARLTQAPDYWQVAWPMDGGEDAALVVDVAFAALYGFMRQRFGDACRLRGVDLPRSGADDTSAYARFFGCPVQFGSIEPGLRFEVSAAHREIPLDEHGEFAVLRQQQDQAFDRVVNASDSFLRRLRQVTLRLLPGGDVSLTRIAEELHVSPRTLQRHLSRYQMSYQHLLDGLREQLATRYLVHTDLSLAQLAALLGFSEQSAFQRAFKQWTGRTPGQYRAARRQDSRIPAPRRSSVPNSD